MITSVLFGVMDKDAAKQVRAMFFRAREGTEPVREWLRPMPKEDRRQVGLDIKTVEYGWPIGMPTCRSLGEGLWEVRTKLRDREVRISFFLKGAHMILTHGFVKKERRTPLADLRLARDRKRQWEVRGVTSSIENPHLGTALDDFLAEDGLLESANRTAASRASVWQEERKSLWQVAQSGYDVFVLQDGGPLVCVTDENASALGVYVKGWDSEQRYLEKQREGEIGDEAHREISRTYLNFEPTRPSTLYVVYSTASSPDDRPHDLCVNRRYAPPGDTVYVGGFGYLLCLSYGAGHAIRLGGIGRVYRRYGEGHAIRYDGEGQLRGGECYDLIRHHLGRIAHVAEVNPDAPAFDPGHGNVERSSDHAGIAFRGGDGPGSIRGDSRQDDRPKRGRRKLRLYHDWPLNKEEREDKELEYCFRTWSASDSSLDYGDLACVSRGERPDRIIRNQKTGKEYGVELTAVYLDDRSVIDHHRMVKSEAKSWFLHEWAQIQDYLHCIARRVEEKVSKAQGYDNQRDLILAVYLNERILSQYFTRELEEFIREHQAFRSIDPFVHIVFSGIVEGVVYP